MSAPIASKLDYEQCIQGSYDEATGRLRVETEIATVTVGGNQEILITDNIDSIKIGNGSGVYTQVKSDGTDNALVVIQNSQPLAIGAATAANQVLEQNKLDVLHTDNLSIQTKQDTGNSSLSSIDSHINVNLSTRATEATVSQIDTDLLSFKAVNHTDITSPQPRKIQDGSGNNLTSTLNQTSKQSLDVNITTIGQKTMTNSTPVVLASDQTSIPASQSGTWNINNISGSVSLPTNAATETTLSNLNSKVVAVNTGNVTVSSSILPTGASTSAKQPSLGTAGTASTDVITVQGIASMTAIKVDGSAVTQPVSISGNQAVNLTQVAGASVSVGHGTASGAIRVELPTDGTGVVNATQNGTWNINNVSGTISLPTGAATSVNQSTEITSINQIDTDLLAFKTANHTDITGGTAKSQIVDGSNNTIGSLVSAGVRQLAVSITQNVIASSNNSSTSNLASSATFTGTSDSTLGVAALQVNFFADQKCTIQVQQSTDGTNWDIADSYTIAASTGDGRTIQATGSFFRVLVTNNGGSTTTSFRLQSVLCPVADSIPRTLTGGGQLKTADVINTSGQYRAQSVTTSAAEAFGAATILLNRKFISLTPTNGTIYWGFNSSVTTSNGTPLFKNQTTTISATDNIHIFVIAATTTDCRIVEGS